MHICALLEQTGVSRENQHRHRHEIATQRDSKWDLNRGPFLSERTMDLMVILHRIVSKKNYFRWKFKPNCIN